MNPKLFTFLVLAIDLLVSIIAFIIGKRLPKDILITIVSAIQLLATSMITWKIYKTRSSQHPSYHHITFSYFVWAIVAAGFLFLAIDEVVEIHEGIDKLIHKVFQIKETGLTDRIDDLIIGVYGLVGIGVLLF